jgi:prophage antirepressor-like protein
MEFFGRIRGGERKVVEAVCRESGGVTEKIGGGESMSELQLQRVFEFQGNKVRTVIVDEEPCFVVKDVCEVLGISKYRDVVAHLEEDERVSISMDTPGGKQGMIAVNEPGLYRLIFSSQRGEAKVFKRWVFHEVLPSIRRTGSYSLPANATIAQLLPAVCGEERARELIEANMESDQVTIGFPFHDDRFVTVKEASDRYGIHPESCIWAEIRSLGLLDTVLCRPGEYGVSYQRPIERLTEKGKEYGEEILNRRRRASKTAREPFSFRWRKDKMAEILRYYIAVCRHPERVWEDQRDA